MTANTGYNDPNSIYNSGALSWVTGLSDAAAKVISATRSGPAPALTTSALAAQNGNPTNASNSKWLWIAGAVVVVLALVFFVRK